jgi:DNA-3-methyladenine glycosylase I
LSKIKGEEWSPPDWIYPKDKKPTSDDAYYENLLRVMFAAGLNWSVIDKKWPGFKRAFRGFSINEVARFTEEDVESLMGDTGIVRNRRKIVAAIDNAKQFQAIKEEFGSFQKYLDSLDKSDNYSKVVKDLGKKFSHVGPSTAAMFLWTVGEEIKHHEDDPW